jgi:PAS domain S-box-containing protein
MSGIVDNAYNWLKGKCVASTETPSLDRLINSMEELHGIAKAIKEELKQERAFWESKVQRQEAIMEAMMEVLPDMLWMKDLEGNYLYANKAIRDGLLFDRDPIGKNDVTMALAAKERFGADNHTFGEVCDNSDVVVINKTKDGSFTKDDGRFLEEGKVKGEMMHLEVFKAPVFFEGELIGVVGSGRDLTEYINAYIANECIGAKCPMITAGIFNKFKFSGKEE